MQSATNISSQADRIKFSQGNKVLDDHTLKIKLHPGEKFNVTVIVLDRTGSPVSLCQPHFLISTYIVLVSIIDLVHPITT